MHDPDNEPRDTPAQNSLTVIILGLLAVGLYFLHFPGQATYDTLAQAYDGATREYTSNQPPAMSLILSWLTLPGMLALQIALFTAAAWRVLTLAGGTVGTQRCVLVILFLFPVLMIYVGIVWKDVLFAHAAVLAVLLLPATAPGKHWFSLALSAALLAVAVAVRQQAVIVATVAALYLLWAEGTAGLRSSKRWLAACLWIAVFSLGTLGIKASIQSSGNTSASVAYLGPVRQLAMFDLGGILTRVPDLKFPAITAGAAEIPVAHRPTRDRVVNQLRRYSPDRQDFMEVDTDVPLWILPQAWLADWRTNVRKHPLAYIAHRIDATSWLLGFHDLTKCAPYALGIVSHPEHMVARLGVAPGMSGRAQMLRDLGDDSLLLFQPWIYIALSLVTTAYLVAKGERKHGPVITLQLCGLLYAASYLFIGFACDFRYTYFTTISALFGAAYVAAEVTRYRYSISEFLTSSAE